MKSILSLSACVAVAVVATACADLGSTPSADLAGSVAAFQSVPAGFSSTSSSFDAGGDLDDAFQPHRGDGSFDDDSLGNDRRGGRGPGGRGEGERGEHRGRGDGFGFLMGGGIGPEFLGEI